MLYQQKEATELLEYHKLFIKIIIRPCDQPNQSTRPARKQKPFNYPKRIFNTKIKIKEGGFSQIGGVNSHQHSDHTCHNDHLEAHKHHHKHKASHSQDYAHSNHHVHNHKYTHNHIHKHYEHTATHAKQRHLKRNTWSILMLEVGEEELMLKER